MHTPDTATAINSAVRESGTTDWVKVHDLMHSNLSIKRKRLVPPIETGALRAHS